MILFPPTSPSSTYFVSVLSRDDVDGSRPRKRNHSAISQSQSGGGTDGQQEEEQGCVGADGTASASAGGSGGPKAGAARTGSTSAAIGAVATTGRPGLPQSPWPSFMDHLDTRENVSAVMRAVFCRIVVTVSCITRFAFLAPSMNTSATWSCSPLPRMGRGDIPCHIVFATGVVLVAGENRHGQSARECSLRCTH